MMKSCFKHKSIKVYLILLFAVSAGITGCTPDAATITVFPTTGSLPTTDTGTIHPMIQVVYPGTLQTLDIPDPVATDISPYYPGIVAVFSDTMENSSGELTTALVLVEVTTGYPNVPVTISPSAASNYFTVTPQYDLKPDTEYILRIHKHAFARTLLDSVTVSSTGAGGTATIVTAAKHGLKDNDPVTISNFVGGHAGYNTTVPVTVKVVNSTTFTYTTTAPGEGTTADTTGRIHVYYRTLVFDNLVNPPALTLSPADPDYVEYRFKTGHVTGDVTPPNVVVTNPANGDINVTPSPIAGNGYIEIIFNDNMVPMIDPFTVTNSSVTLRDVTNGVDVPGNIDCYFTDTDFKTYRFIPLAGPYLQPNTMFRLSFGNLGFYVKDFGGNVLTQSDVFFSTGN